MAMFLNPRRAPQGGAFVEELPQHSFGQQQMSIQNQLDPDQLLLGMQACAEKSSESQTEKGSSSSMLPTFKFSNKYPDQTQAQINEQVMEKKLKEQMLEQ